MKIVDGVVTERKVVTDVYQQYGYGNIAEVINSNGIVVRNNNDEPSKDRIATRRRWTNSNVNRDTGVDGTYFTNTAPLSPPTQKQIQIKYVDQDTNSEIKSDTVHSEYGGQYYTITAPASIGNYEYTSVADTGDGQLLNSDVTVTLYYKIDNQKVLDEQKATEKAALEDTARKTKEAIDNDPTLSSEEKAAQKAAVDSEREKANQAIDSATDTDGIQAAKESGEAAIEAQHKPGVSVDEQKNNNEKKQSFSNGQKNNSKNLVNANLPKAGYIENVNMIIFGLVLTFISASRLFIRKEGNKNNYIVF